MNDKQRDYYYRRYYGITLDQYNELSAETGDNCFCCGKPEKTGRRLSVDHDHLSGQIRGLLCFKCNHYLIGRHRDSLPFQQAADYLSRAPTGFVVPEQFLKGRKKRRKRKNKN